MRISDWSSDVCSSDLGLDAEARGGATDPSLPDAGAPGDPLVAGVERRLEVDVRHDLLWPGGAPAGDPRARCLHVSHCGPSSAVLETSRRRCGDRFSQVRGVRPRSCERTTFLLRFGASGVRVWGVETAYAGG